MISLGRRLGSLLLGLTITALLASGLAVALPIEGWTPALAAAVRSAAIVEPAQPVTVPAPVTELRTVPRALVAAVPVPTTPPTAEQPVSRVAVAEQTGAPTATAGTAHRVEKASAEATPKPVRKAVSAATGSGPVAAVIAATNAERAEAGCGPVRADSRLSSAAQRHASDMAANDYFSHTDQNGNGSADRMRDAGFSGSATGENIAYGQESASEVVSAWMDSAGHRENILDCDYTRVGVGYDSRGDYWVQDFGG